MMDELAKRLAELTDKISQPALDAARGAVQAEVYSCLTGGVLLIVASIGLTFGGKMLWNNNSEDQFDRPMISALGFCVFIVAGIIALAGIWHFIDPWTWIALSHPDLWLAKKVLKL